MLQYLIYLDESGIPQATPQNTHYALAGVAIPANSWAAKRDALEALRQQYGIGGLEIHVAWLLRPYVEQAAIPDFETLTREARRDAVLRLRAGKLKAVEARGASHQSRELRTFHRKSAAYVHLTLAERQGLARDVADLAASWSDLVLFGEVVDKRVPNRRPPDETAYEQVVTRFEAMLARRSAVGVVAYDANETIAERLTSLTADYQRVGATWRRLTHIGGHPFFVASHLSDMIQIADVVAYGLRRYCEKGETDLLNRYFSRFDRLPGRLVGLRHYRGGRQCSCMICAEPRRRPRRTSS